MTRCLLLILAIFIGAYSLASWICAMPTDAGISGAISAACVLVAEGIAYCQRGRMRHGREQVWERREQYTAEALFEARQRLWDERRPVETFTVFDKVGDPVSAFDSLGHTAVKWGNDKIVSSESLELDRQWRECFYHDHGHRAIWPQEIGGFE